MRELLRATMCREIEAVSRCVAGLELWVRAAPVQCEAELNIVRPILEGDEYELEPIHAAGHRVDTVVDVGSHVGAFSLRAKKLWPRATVVAVEPDPETAQIYRRNTSHLAGIVFHELAAAAPGVDEVRLCQMGRSEWDGNTGGTFVVDAVARLDPSMVPGGPICIVRAATLSSVLSANGVEKIDVLKLDCEGSEAEILHDLKASGHLRHVRWLRGEWHRPASIPLIEAALGDTHICAFAPTSHPWGYFIAHHRDLSR